MHTPADLRSSAGLPISLIESLIHEHERTTLPRLNTFYRYYRNELAVAPAAGPLAERTAARPYTLAQQRGLPPRLHSRSRPGVLPDDRVPTAEIVIENDIAWRLNAMVDFMFGRPLKFVSSARADSARSNIQAALEAVWEASGGIGLLQDMALLAHIYGHVDLVLRAAPTPPAPDGAPLPGRAASALRIEIVEPTRGIAALDPHDYRRLQGYIIRIQRPRTQQRDNNRGAAGATQRHDDLPAAHSPAPRWLRAAAAAVRTGLRSPEPDRDTELVTEVLTPLARELYAQPAGESESPLAGAQRLEREPNTLCPGLLPIVHIQNVSQPFAYEGLSEVEPLIPLQDELNTRLSDRASRVTLQSFKMYLVKGIDGFSSPVGPGQLFFSDDPSASIEAFGGDAASPSEDRHIEEIREALDKASGVPPLATGVVRAKVGNLSSENALRITLTGLLARTARKQITYGRALADMCSLILAALDHAGILRTDPDDRAVKVHWPDPLPVDDRRQLENARLKADLGVPRERLLAELGYAPFDPGVV